MPSSTSFSLPENGFFTVLLFLEANFVTWALDPLSCRSKGHVSLMNSFLHFQSLPSYWSRSFRSQVAHVLLLFSALPNVTTYRQTIHTSCNPLSDLCSSEITVLKGERPPGHNTRKPFLLSFSTSQKEELFDTIQKSAIRHKWLRLH